MTILKDKIEITDYDPNKPITITEDKYVNIDIEVDGKTVVCNLPVSALKGRSIEEMKQILQNNYMGK